MKYFKPELLARCRSEDDDIAEAAAQEWEQAIGDYRARVRAIRWRFPRGVRRLLSRVALHDAKILTLAFGERQPAVTLQIKLEDTSSRPGGMLELSYLSVAGPDGGALLRKHAESSNGNPGLEWILYDEFDLDEPRAFFTHSLLLAGGYELQVRFHNLRVRRLREVIIPPQRLPEVQRTWPLVEA